MNRSRLALTNFGANYEFNPTFGPVILGVRPKDAMDDEFLACVYSLDSHRHAVLADDGVTGILYLHAPSDDAAKTGEVEATCFAYNRVDPIDAKEVQRYRPNPPPIAKGYASKDAVCRRPDLHKWNLKFSSDGLAVLLIRDGKPWAMVSLDARRGFSKAIEAPGPWGSPWSSEVHKSFEWDGRTCG
jgi:hypothetical protein